ncbi:MAG: PIN domain-containing protein [Actinomycetota bacterium]|nr:PIN domain-containing protein [Actinomycetota bacterium]
MSEAPRPPRAVLDADVIFSRVLHELLGRVASQLRLLTLIWSDELLGEAECALIERKAMPRPAARRWVDYLREAFPDERVDVSRVLASTNLDELTADPDDQHVCALAIAGRADLLLTFDRGYLSEPLARRHGIEVLTPDAFLLSAFAEEPQALAQVVEAQARGWGGGRAIEELLDAIQRAGAPTFAAGVRDVLRT